MGDGSVYTGEFDVLIGYADRELPDVQAAAEGGGQEGGSPLPDCPPFIPVLKETGKAVPLGNEDDQVPAARPGWG